MTTQEIISHLKSDKILAHKVMSYLKWKHYLSLDEYYGILRLQQPIEKIAHDLNVSIKYTKILIKQAERRIRQQDIVHLINDYINPPLSPWGKIRSLLLGRPRSKFGILGGYPKGFTLLECLMVLAIIAILSAIAISEYFHYIEHIKGVFNF